MDSAFLKIKRWLTLVSFPVMLLVFSPGAFAQSRCCDGYDKKVKYEILSDNVTVKNGQREIFLQIYIRPEGFTVASMIRLVEALRARYYDFDSVVASFYNTRKQKKLPDPPPQPLSAWIGTLPSGLYEYDKNANKSELSFRERRNGTVYSIEIAFNDRGYCVSEEIYQPESPPEP